MEIFIYLKIDAPKWAFAILLSKRHVISNLLGNTGLTPRIAIHATAHGLRGAVRWHGSICESIWRVMRVKGHNSATTFKGLEDAPNSVHGGLRGKAQ